MTMPYQQVFSRRASPFMRLVLSPFLLLFAAVFFIPLFDAIEEDRQAGVIACSLVILACIAGFLALWGVPFVGRIVTGIIALVYGWYVIDMCFIQFDGSWGWGDTKSARTPINSMLGFLVFGLPCLIYTIFGRFTLRNEVESEEGMDDPIEEDDTEEPRNPSRREADQVGGGNGEQCREDAASDNW